MRRLVYAFIAIAILLFAVGFPAYMAFGQGNPAQVTITVTAKPVVRPPGGGGGGGKFPSEAGCPSGQTSCVGMITTTGRVIRTIVVTSLEGQFQLTIDVGTIALQHDGSPIRCIGIIKTETLPSPPAGAYVVSVWYDVFPEGATFSPTATLEYIAAPGTIPTGGDGDRLVIAYYDEATGAWIELDSAADTQNSILTAQTTRFSDFAVFGYGVEAPPAAFQVSSLSISPRAAYPNQTVDITALVTNTGGQAGIYQVTLKVNGVAEETQELVLGAGDSQLVSFTTTKETAGTYSVDIGGATSTFEVKERPVVPTKHFNWWLIIAIIAAMALAAETTYVIRKRKKYGGVTGVLSAQVEWVTSTAKKLASKVATAFRSLPSKIRNIKIKW